MVEPQIIRHLFRSASGIITACRSDREREENWRANHLLVATIRSNGYGAITIKVGGHENSFFIFNKDQGNDDGKLENFLIGQGERFDLDFVVSIPFAQPAVVIGTSMREDSYPHFEQRIPFESRKLSEFQVVDDFPAPRTINGIRGEYLLSQKHPKQHIFQ